jgi:hypothetical protein
MKTSTSRPAHTSYPTPRSRNGGDTLAQACEQTDIGTRRRLVERDGGEGEREKERERRRGDGDGTVRKGERAEEGECSTYPADMVGGGSLRVPTCSETCG